MKKALLNLSFTLIVLLQHTTLSAEEDQIISAVMRAENRLKAQLGISVLDLQTQQRWAYRADRRFPLNSTFKTLACAELLRRVDKGEETLDRTVTFSARQLVTYSPVTKQYAGHKAISLEELCHATMTLSDNTAANLILETLGGPDAITRFSRIMADEVTRLDRWETALNEATPGDIRDTTSPNAMVNNLHRLLFSDLLSPASRQQLRLWMMGNEVADNLLRAVVPADWQVADRTGSGGHGSRAITAVLFPPNRQPVIVAIYLTQTDSPFVERNRAIREIGTAVVATISQLNTPD